MLHRMSMDVCDSCGRVHPQDEIDEFGVCEKCKYIIEDCYNDDHQESEEDV
jgi:RNA polymerase subunit RPABC4/transcription elongation factor Spt4